ncbi:hypothetical protein [Geomesophilobacter sediminis]|uniref:Chitin-binding type-2 domain-containing protein n=1 Tax=Geomesophilobacter sediminis TaxID=2798584 RepID=A0A8J7IN16_9BACT|nr:hypothetical protein [Geomesophilobacter sediminis]MBJ6724413.1 hypothetical protein [Geomesophilobacter sediminis]
MKKTRHILFAVLALLLVGALPAYARGGAHVGIWFGPVWGPFYPYPYYYAPPPVIVHEEPQPPIFIEPPQAEEQHYWYYCTNPKGYYPYVKECPDGWTTVSPRPPERKE